MAGNPKAGRSLLDQAGEASGLARDAFAVGNPVVGLAALTLAAQLVQLARIRENMKIGP